LRLRLFRRGLASFSRYSPALKSSDVVWNDKTLDEWLKDPQQVVPGNQMTFPGMKDARHAPISLHLSNKQPSRGGLRRRRPHNNTNGIR
jgi:cytochrome c2